MKFSSHLIFRFPPHIYQTYQEIYDRAAELDITIVTIDDALNDLNQKYRRVFHDILERMKTMDPQQTQNLIEK